MMIRRDPHRPIHRTHILARTGACALVTVLLVAGCGSGSRTRGPKTGTAAASDRVDAPFKSSSDAQTLPESVPAINLTLTTPGISQSLPMRYTCDGANESIPLGWSRVPRGTAEVDVFVLSSLPIHGKFVVAWAVAGLSPHIRLLTAGRLPADAIVGHNSFGQARYSVCPPKRTTQQYAVLLYALPHHIAVKRGFDAEALVEGKLVHVAKSEGQTGFSYKRR